MGGHYSPDGIWRPNHTMPGYAAAQGAAAMQKQHSTHSHKSRKSARSARSSKSGKKARTEPIPVPRSHQRSGKSSPHSSTARDHEKASLCVESVCSRDGDGTDGGGGTGLPAPVHLAVGLAEGREGAESADGEVDLTGELSQGTLAKLAAAPADSPSRPLRAPPPDGAARVTVVQAAPPAPRKRGFFSRLFGGKQLNAVGEPVPARAVDGQGRDRQLVQLVGTSSDFTRGKGEAFGVSGKRGNESLKEQSERARAADVLKNRQKADAERGGLFQKGKLREHAPVGPRKFGVSCGCL